MVIKDIHSKTKIDYMDVMLFVWYGLVQKRETGTEGEYIVTTKIEIEDITPSYDEQGFKEVQDYIINNNLTLQEVFEPLILNELSLF